MNRKKGQSWELFFFFSPPNCFTLEKAQHLQPCVGRSQAWARWAVFREDLLAPWGAGVGGECSGASGLALWLSLWTQFSSPIFKGRHEKSITHYTRLLENLFSELSSNSTVGQCFAWKTRIALWVVCFQCCQLGCLLQGNINSNLWALISSVFTLSLSPLTSF